MMMMIMIYDDDDDNDDDNDDDCINCLSSCHRKWTDFCFFGESCLHQLRAGGQAQFR